MRKVRPTTGVESFDPKLCLYLLSFLDDKTLGNFLCLSKKWRRLAGSVDLWEPHFRNIRPGYGYISHPEEKDGNLKVGSVQRIHFIPAYAKEIEKFKKRQERAKVRNVFTSWVEQHECLFLFALSATSSGWSPLYWLPVFVFSILLPLKMDSPGRFSWLVTFSPLWAFDFLLLSSLISYWGVSLCCPQIYVPGRVRNWNMDYAVWKTRFNLIWNSMEIVPRRSFFAVLWRLVNSMFLLLFICFTISFPISVDLGIGLTINQNLLLLLGAGAYCTCVIAPLSIREFATQDVGDMVGGFAPLHDAAFFGTMFSVVPGLALTALMFYLKLVKGMQYSFVIAMIPMFTSHCAIVCMSCIGGTVKSCCHRYLYVFYSLDSIFCLTLLGIGAISPVIVFEVLLLYHLEAQRFSYVIAFIPMWILTCCLCCAGCAFSLDYFDRNKWNFQHFGRDQPNDMLLFNDMDDEV
jgi:hypothetical protein